MENLTIREQYGVLDTLYSDEIQKIYIAEDITECGNTKLIINEIIDEGMSLCLKGCFDTQTIVPMSNFVEAFYVDSKLYIVGKVCEGSLFGSYLSENSLRLSDKMYIAENFLSYFSKLDGMNPILRHIFCNPECLSVIGRKSICLNVNFKPKSEDLNADSKATIRRAADILCALFANTPDATLEADKDNIPPSIYAILKKCYDGQYDSFAQVHKDFKASLLYSTFIDSSSVDKQIMKNIKKAKLRKSVYYFRRTVALLILVGIIAGIWQLAHSPFIRNILPTGSDTQAVNKPGENHKPNARFTASKSKVEVGDEVIFVSESSDPDQGDSIKSYEWTIGRENGMKSLFANEQTAKYTFSEAGKYTINLTVKDSNGTISDTYSIEISVAEKQDIPPSDGTSTEPNDAK
ncbi:MAG: PKD domain-containing protein [Bacillota bacterium]